MSAAPENPYDSGLDDLVRRMDNDRWLASRFVSDLGARTDVVALVAFNYELARVAGGVTSALMGEIRLTWWREAMEELAAGKAPRKHPAVEALAASGADPLALAAMAEARLADLEEPPFADEAAVLAYLDATAGALATLIARRLDPAADASAVRAAARAYGLAGLWRLKLAGRSRLPLAWTAADVETRVAQQRKAAAAELKALPIAAFPAVAPAALATRQAKGGEMSELEKKARLTWSVATGRI
ncbi:squalene/phytoene synthase family protein [Caulobacter endophyticus]|uniref:squalene/phytoene synthase family protein n=1 Tax=Caulobacter endophyticus TaxID=2172652 RepID=UPI00240F382F|nr:squalene/phytoene synthase family protein [Caulobacter endophyticus]MDG2527422.1 squalene/phytoene synthase family protein [Caulobacter endophyticus]